MDLSAGITSSNLLLLKKTVFIQNKPLNRRCRIKKERLITDLSSSFECLHCPMTFPKSKKLKQHLLCHSNERPYHCSICQKGFKKKGALNFHIKNIHNTSREYPCETCGKVIANKKYYEFHMQGHRKDYNIFCEYCGKGFVYKHQHKVHLEIKHSTAEQSFVCDVCGKGFPLASYLKRHQMRHEENPQKKITATECKICKKSYVRINRHNREFHSNEGASYMCDLCGQKFRQSFELKLHTMRHKGEKPHKCSYAGCDKSFVRKQHLNLHMRSHTGEKPFECKICGKTYTQKPTLVVHMRGHLGERPYECDLCVSKFASKQRLNIHKRKVHKLIIVCERTIKSNV